MATFQNVIAWIQLVILNIWTKQEKFSFVIQKQHPRKLTNATNETTTTDKNHNGNQFRFTEQAIEQK